MTSLSRSMEPRTQTSASRSWGGVLSIRSTATGAGTVGLGFQGERARGIDFPGREARVALRGDGEEGRFERPLSEAAFNDRLQRPLSTTAFKGRFQSGSSERPFKAAVQSASILLLGFHDPNLHRRAGLAVHEDGDVVDPDLLDGPLEDQPLLVHLAPVPGQGRGDVGGGDGAEEVAPLPRPGADVDGAVLE